MPFLSKKVNKLFSNKNRSNRRWSTNEANIHTARRKTVGRQIQLFRQLSLVLENKKTMAQNAELATAAATAAMLREDDEEREHDSRRGGLFGMSSMKKFGSSKKMNPEDELEPPTITTTTTRTDKRLLAAEELSEEDDSTFESSPTPTPNNDTRETVETDAMSLPDVPKLNFPSHNGEQKEPAASMHNRSVLDPSKKQGRRQLHSVSDMRSSSLKPSSSSRNRRKHSKPPFLNQYDDEGEYEEWINREKGLDDAPPPVDLVSFSSAPSKASPVFAKMRGCISGPPPRASEWDDETIESHSRDETDASTETMSTMKPWIDRAAKLALLQNKANQHDRHNGQGNTMDYDYDYLDRRRLTPMKWEATDASASAVVALPRFRPGMDCSHPTRARMASEEQQRRHLHKRHNQKGAQSKQPREDLMQQERKSIEDLEHQEQDKMPLPPASPHRRVVKWTTVRQSAGN